jgi:Flagellar basal body P-ring biosynthesis protein
MMRLIKTRRGGLDRLAIILAVVTALFLVAAATTAFAQPVTLKAQPEDGDGRVTLGDIFDAAGAAGQVEVGQRVGPSVVFEASYLQMAARQAGLHWANPTGLRRVIVRRAPEAIIEAATADIAEASSGPVYRPGTMDTPARPLPIPAATGSAQPNPPAAPRPAVQTPGRDRVIARNDIVEVIYEVGGVRLSVTGRAEGQAAVGQRIAIRNLQSNRTIDAVATGPGQAMAGPNARAVQ